jgi:ATP-dependent helicase HrpB
MDTDDWRLIYEEACAGKNSWSEMEKVPLEAQVGRYLGPVLMGFLDKTFPVRRKLPSGRTGKLTYFEQQPPELAARLEDFLGLTGTITLCEGRLAIIFDILSPGFRTVQKTQDLGSFWKNAYPSVKKELQRRYPRHPWP